MRFVDRRAVRVAKRVDPALLVITVAGFAVVLFYVSRVTEWLVMTDELQYTKLGLSIAQTGSLVPHLRGEYFPSFAQLYPLLLSPPLGLLDMPAAFRVAHGLNALLMVSTAVPAYLLVRGVSSSRLAANVAAALTVAVPWMAMSAALLTEVVAYPAFAWAVLAIQRATAAPSDRRDALALVALVVAFAARPQFVILVLLFPAVVIVHEVGYAITRPGDRSRTGALARAARDVLVAHRVLVVAAVLAVLVGAVLAVRGSLGLVLGTYAATASGTLLPPNAVRAAITHLDYVAVGIGVLPLGVSLGWCVSVFFRPVGKAAHALAVVTLVTIPAVCLEVASYDLRFVNGLTQTRYLFYVIPLFFAGTVLALTDARRRWLAVAVGGVAGALLVGLTQYVPAPGPYFSAPETIFHVVLSGRAQQLGSIVGISDLSAAEAVRAAGLVGAALVAGVLALAPRRAGLIVVAVVLLVVAIPQTLYVLHRMVQGPNQARPVSGTSDRGRDWIDAVPGDFRVALIPSPVNAAPVGLDQAGYFGQTLWWETEFWNKSVDRSISVDRTDTYTPFPAELLTEDWATGVLRGGAVRERVVVTTSDVRFQLRARKVLAVHGTQALLDVPRPYRVSWASRGLAPDGNPLLPEPVVIRLYSTGASAERVRVSVGLGPVPSPPGPRRFVLAARSSRTAGTVGVVHGLSASVTACRPARGHRDVRLRFPGIRPGGPPLGVHVGPIAVTRLGRGCS